MKILTFTEEILSGKLNFLCSVVVMLKKQLFADVFQKRLRCSLKEILLKACNFIKSRLQHRSFPRNISKLLKTPFSQNTSGLLHLILLSWGNLLI